MINYGQRDLMIENSDINLSDTTPSDGSIIDITATVRNPGSVDVTDIEVGFYLDN